MHERCQEKNEAYVEKWSTISFILHPFDFARGFRSIISLRGCSGKTNFCKVHDFAAPMVLHSIAAGSL